MSIYDNPVTPPSDQEPVVSNDTNGVIADAIRKPGYEVGRGDPVLPQLGNAGQYHVACALVLDTSGSMGANGGEAIEQLNLALKTLKDDLMCEDKITRGCLDICVIGFDDQPTLLTDGFVTADKLKIPTLTPGGLTNMYAAIQMAYEQIKKRRKEYVRLSIPHYVPWLFLLTDGLPTDGGQPASQYGTDGAEIIRFVKEKEAKAAFYLYGVGTGGYDRDFMLRLCAEGACMEATAGSFRDLFKWLSASLSSLSQSKPDETTVSPTLPASVITIRK